MIICFSVQCRFVVQSTILNWCMITNFVQELEKDMNISELIYSKKYAVFNSKHMYITYIDAYPDQICLSFYPYQVYGNVVMFGNHFWRLQLE